MLLEYGNTTCTADWKIDENTPTGYCRVYYVYGGGVQYTDNQRQTALRPGYLYIFPSASPYRMRQSAADPLRCTFLHIDISPSIATELVECPVVANRSLRHLLWALSSAIDDTDDKLIYALAEVFELYVFEHGFIVPPIHALSKVLLFIADHIAETITLGRLSAIAGYNEQYFVRLFRKSIGLTPYQYIIAQRMKAAKMLLTKGISIARTSEMTGYRDIKSFSRAFKKAVGMTPSTFRRTHIVMP